MKNHGNTPFVLGFAEDTGTANFIARVPEILAPAGIGCRMLASEYGVRQLHRLGNDCETIGPGMTAESLIAAGPALVMIGAGNNLDSFGLGLIAAARQAGIQTAGVIDQRQNLGDRFRGRMESPLFYAPDWILVPDAASQDYFSGLGHPPDRVLVCGHPHYDTIYRIGKSFAEADRKALRARLFPDCPDGTPILVFGAEPAKAMRGTQGAYRRTPDYTLSGRGASAYRTNIVIEELLDALTAIGQPVYKILRLHPHDPADDEFAAYYEEFDFVSDSGLPDELVLASDLVVSISSMLLTEAMLLGRPTLSIVPRPGDSNLLLTVESGLTPCVHRREDLRDALVGSLSDPTPPPRDAVERIFPPDSMARLRTFLHERLGVNAEPGLVSPGKV